MSLLEPVARRAYLKLPIAAVGQLLSVVLGYADNVGKGRTLNWREFIESLAQLVRTSNDQTEENYVERVETLVRAVDIKNLARTRPITEPKAVRGYPGVGSLVESVTFQVRLLRLIRVTAYLLMIIPT